MGIQKATAIGVAASGNARIDGLLWGGKWAGSVSYSDPDAPSDYGAGYPAAALDGFARLGAGQLAAAQTALDVHVGPPARAGFAVEGFTGLGVSYAGGSAGDIRIANSADPDTAYAYLPGTGEGGDVWLGGAGVAPRAGNYDWAAIQHEIGHALGLKHPHEGGGLGVLPRAWDSIEFSVMSYHSYVGSPTDFYRFEDWGAPQSWMMLDIAALQQLYGADFTVNAGDTSYRWTPGSGRTLVDGQVGIDPGGNRIFATIWDGGGEDTYDLSAYASSLRLDLRPGRHSVFAAGQLADLDFLSSGGRARGNIFNALTFEGDRRSLIENATGGSGHDRLAGNGAANRLAGDHGNDRLRGFAGADELVGGSGADRLLGGAGADELTGGTGGDVFVFDDADSRPGACDRLVAGDGAAAFQLTGPGRCDRIDLRGIDADLTRPGDQAFLFGAAETRGHLWLDEVGAVTYLRGNVDADAPFEFELAILDGGVRASAYTVHDFLL